MQKILDLKRILKNFLEYPYKEYPPEPIWDRKGKRYIHPITKKTIDMKKPYILPLVAPKKKKKKRKKRKKKKEKEEN